MHIHANPFGHKVCDCAEQGISNCSCPRHFSDPDVSIGWNSGLGIYYFGYTLYMIACHNEEFHIDRPLHFRFLDAKRHDMKWRCPAAAGKEEKCTCGVPCSSSSYGRCLYTKSGCDIRLYPPIARGTDEYKKTYNNCTGSERVNDRILNDYHLHDMKIHGKKDTLSLL